MCRYDLVIQGRTCNCPECSGLMKPIVEQIAYKCIDCNATFQIIDKGYLDNSVIMERKNNGYI